MYNSLIYNLLIYCYDNEKCKQNNKYKKKITLINNNVNVNINVIIIKKLK